MGELDGPSLCALAARVNGAWQINVVYSLLCVFDVAGIFITLHILWLLVTTQVFHVHLRIFLANLSFALALRNFLTLYRAAWNLFLSLAAHNNCDMVKTSHECLLQSAANLVPISVVHVSFLLISVERILATLFYKSYEKVRLIALTLFGVALTWFIPLFVGVTKIVRPFDDSQKVFYCSSITSGATNAPLRFGRRKFANQNLTERYQLLENLKTTRLIAVVVLTFAMSLIIDIGTVIVLIYLQTKNYEAMALWK
ncbi:Protein SRAB-14 b, partial [Aphelenchoides avenae]